jgi:hypothetical protein
MITHPDYRSRKRMNALPAHRNLYLVLGFVCRMALRTTFSIVRRSCSSVPVVVHVSNKSTRTAHSLLGFKVSICCDLLN